MNGYTIFELIKKEFNAWIEKQKRGYEEGKQWMLNKKYEKYERVESDKKCLKKT